MSLHSVNFGAATSFFLLKKWNKISISCLHFFQLPFLSQLCSSFRLTHHTTQAAFIKVTNDLHTSKAKMYSANWTLEQDVTLLRLHASLNTCSSKLSGSWVTLTSLPFCLLCSPLLQVTFPSVPGMFSVCPPSWLTSEFHDFTVPLIPWQLQTSNFYWLSLEPQAESSVFPGNRHSKHTRTYTTLGANSSPLLVPLFSRVCQQVVV